MDLPNPSINPSIQRNKKSRGDSLFSSANLNGKQSIMTSNFDPLDESFAEDMIEYEGEEVQDRYAPKEKEG
jgi:hypothetical protein